MFHPIRRRAILLIWLAVFVLAAGPTVHAQANPPQGDLVILLSNDDGYDAPGLRALADALKPLGEIYVSAPAVEQSGKGHSIITTRDPIFLREYKQPNGVSWYAVEAPPATCVRLAIESLLPRRPNLVISGINRGGNLGMSVYLSGTLGAAREAALSGIPAIAISMEGNNPRDYAATADYLRGMIEQLRAKGMLKPGLFLNVNHPAGEPKGVKIAPLSMKTGDEKYERRTSPRGRVYFWSAWEPSKDDAEGTDVWWLVRGFITVTPMVLDVTDTGAMKALEGLEPRAAMPANK